MTLHIVQATDFPQMPLRASGHELAAAPPETIKVLGKLLTMLIGVALVFVAGIALAAVAKDSTFTTEWANMIAWFQTWAK